MTINSKDLFESYETDIQFPDVSGMEHLDMLMTRSEIAKYEAHFTEAEKERLRKADGILLQNARKFYSAITQVADLAIWRADGNVPPSHWWWFLDVLAQLPDFPECPVAESPDANREYA